MTSRLLILGESDVGKSHFAGQLLGRFNQERGALRMVGAAPNLAFYETVLERLHSGKAAPHTSQNTYVESRWPLANREGVPLELEWPDYGGEQLRALREQRSMPREWRDRVTATQGWIVMVRIAHQQLSDDIFTRPLSSPSGQRQPPGPFIVSPQAQLVDLLQWLMFVRGTGTLRPVNVPRLLLLLSCWDELPSAELHRPPPEVLRARMPLVSGFVESNWRPEALQVLGLSAIERSLSETVVDQEFVDRGPEAVGYVVLPDGSHDADLTLAISALV